MSLIRTPDSTDAETTVVVDLIGDLDPTLASVVAEALDGLAPDAHAPSASGRLTFATPRATVSPRSRGRSTWPALAASP